ncbi:MAG: DUF5916 domain-containing protein [Candidatus Marinimicrobia bacterium]|nr:DUF5916 domain-containing protein [Candidatus Neomarinimicrobiota bacterium]MDP6260894.1 DUF5916 domain-containing protein [Candidatus Neomarinimicrobiota bacterium]MDP7474653.1 DUF5916 domain-containing protein [Candidatus Neomarinimicrobiota bacterium]
MDKLSTVLFFLLPLALVLGEPQEEVQPSAQSENTSNNEKKIVKAIRTDEPVYIDGNLTENIWYKADSKFDFSQYQPKNGEKPNENTMFLVFYDENNLYVGVYVMEKEPSTVMGKLRRRDDMALSDYIWVYIDTENRGGSGYKFGVNPSGVRYDGYISNDDEVDYSWDGVWDAKVLRDFGDQSNEPVQRRVGWTAEFRIPFATLQYDKNKTEEWGFNITRFKGSTFEQMWWKSKEVTEPGLVSHFGKITGISNIKSAGKFEFLPGSVITASSEGFESESALIGSNRLHYNISGDFKYDITTSTRLEASVNPDFGQAEVDPAVLNLSAFETYFPEKRTFFVNGADIFATPFQLFYSRRIGRSAYDGFVPVDIAGKLTGKTGNTTFGMISALTGAKYPFGETGYFVGRVKQSINKGNTNFGILVTHTNDLDNEETPLALGFDWSHQLFNNQFVFSGQYAKSKTNTLTGQGIMLHFAKIGGRHWNFSLGADLRDKNFNIDALGFLDRNNVNSYYMNQSYFTTDPFWKFQETNTALNIWYQENPEEEISNEKLALSLGLSIGTSITLLNQWSFGLDLSKKLPGYDDFDTRGGYIIEDPGTLSLSSWIAPKPGKKVNQQLSLFGGKDDYASKWYGLSYNLELSPREHYSISISPDYAWNYDESQWVDNLSVSHDDWVTWDYIGSVYGKLTSQTISLGIRMNYSFTPDMSLQLFTQPFIAIGKYDSYRLLMENKTYQFAENFLFYNDTLNTENTWYLIDDPSNSYFGIPYNEHNYDFNKKSLNWQSVFRWEYRPGSVLFFVWSFSSYEDQELLDFNISKSYRKLFEQVATHKFLIKYNYWMKL